MLYKKKKRFEAIHNTLSHGFSANQEVFLEVMEFQPFIKLSYFCKLVTHEALRSLNVFMYSGSNLNLEVLVFEDRGKAEYLQKYLMQQGREPTTN